MYYWDSIYWIAAASCNATTSDAGLDKMEEIVEMKEIVKNLYEVEGLKLYPKNINSFPNSRRNI